MRFRIQDPTTPVSPLDLNAPPPQLPQPLMLDAAAEQHGTGDQGQSCMEQSCDRPAK